MKEYGKLFVHRYLYFVIFYPLEQLRIMGQENESLKGEKWSVKISNVNTDFSL